MATEVVKIVDPDNGQGTDYTSLAAWESGEQRNLVTADEIAVAKCRSTNGSADTTAVTVDGWTADNTRHIKIWCDPSESGGDGRNGSYAHKGVWPGTGKKIYRLDASGAALRYYQKVHVENIAIRGTAGVTSGAVRNEAGGNVTHYHIRCYYETTGTGAAYLANNDDSNNIFRNCTFVAAGGYNHSTVTPVMSYCIANGGDYCYNCTAVGRGTVYSCYASHYSNRVLYTYNCIGAALNGLYSGGAVYLAYSGGNIRGDYTTASDGSYPSAATNYWTNVTPSFVDTTNKDYHLSADDTVAKGRGYNYSSIFTDDIDGDTRPSSGAWCIGSDEVVASSTTYTATVSLDALVRKALSGAASLDALLLAEIPVAVSLDALVRMLSAKSAGIDAVVAAPGLGRQASLDGLLARAGISVSHSIDALLARAGIETSAGLDALLIQTSALQTAASLDALLRRSGLLATLSLDALAALRGEAAAALDAILAGAAGEASASLLLDALLAGAAAKSLAMDAMLRRDRLTQTAQIDAWIAALHAAANDLDALLVKGFGLTAGLDALVSSSAATFVRLDALLAERRIRQASLDAIVYGELARGVDLGALLSGGRARGALLDAIVYSALALAIPKARFAASGRVRLCARLKRPRFAAARSEKR